MPDAAQISLKPERSTQHTYLTCRHGTLPGWASCTCVAGDGWTINFCQNNGSPTRSLLIRKPLMGTQPLRPHSGSCGGSLALNSLEASAATPRSEARGMACSSCRRSTRWSFIEISMRPPHRTGPTSSPCSRKQQPSVEAWPPSDLGCW